MMAIQLTEGQYQRLGEMSVDSLQNSSCYGGGYVSVSSHSSVGSNSIMASLIQRTRDRTRRGLTAGSVVHPGVVHTGLGDDALVQALMDDRYPTEGLKEYIDWTIDLRSLNMGPAFAQGAFGKLFKAIYKGEDVAVKILERPQNDDEKAQIMEQQFRQEVMMLATLRHQNVVRFIGACRKPLVWCIVTEYAKGGSLRQALAKKNNGPVALRDTVKKALDVARGMEHLHSLLYIHRDLKSDNLLIAADKSIKIADFGVARIEVQSEGMTPETGTYRWMAPEMIQSRSYNHKVDVYSFGIVLWELVTGMLPFHNMTAVQAAFAVVNRGLRPTIPRDCPPALEEIMRRCWDANPEVRPSFSEVVILLEDARNEIMKTPRSAKIRRCCMALPLTVD